MIRKATPEDAQAICDIYNYYVLNTIVTFEEDIVLADDMAERIKKVSEKYTWLVHEQDEEIIGYAYAGEWKSRCSYRFSVESSVYLKNGFSGHGIGSKLYTAIFSNNSFVISTLLLIIFIKISLSLLNFSGSIFLYLLF